MFYLCVTALFCKFVILLYGGLVNVGLCQPINRCSSRIIVRGFVKGGVLLYALQFFGVFNCNEIYLGVKWKNFHMWDHVSCICFRYLKAQDYFMADFQKTAAGTELLKYGPVLLRRIGSCILVQLFFFFFWGWCTERVQFLVVPSVLLDQLLLFLEDCILLFLPPIKSFFFFVSKILLILKKKRWSRKSVRRL